MKHPLIPKGKAQALHMTLEYQQGQIAAPRSENPYDFFNEYEKHYAWDIGNQNRGFTNGWIQRQRQRQNRQQEIETEFVYGK